MRNKIAFNFFHTLFREGRTFFFFFEVEFFGWKSREQARSSSREGNDKSFQGELHTMQGKVSNLMKVFEMMDGAELNREALDFSIFVTNEVTRLQFVVIERDAKMHKNVRTPLPQHSHMVTSFCVIFALLFFRLSMDAKMYKQCMPLEVVEPAASMAEYNDVSSNFEF